MHIVLKNNSRPPYPENLKQIHFGMGCFWGAERLFWEKKGVWSTAVGYSGGHSESPNYEKICTGKTGHAEIVKVIFDPLEITLLQLATLFWTSHDPTQGMRQGNDIGSQYRSIILANDTKEIELLNRLKKKVQLGLEKNKMGNITTSVEIIEKFYFAEKYHQQYLAKNPLGYCNLKKINIEL